MKKILIIDDDPYICDLLTGYLEQNGYETEGTYSGVNGIKLFLKGNYDLVLCDFRLPDGDGMQILSKIKANNSVVPVIIMTAYADVKIAVKLIKSGAFDYVTKPIQPEEILQLIKRALANKEEKEKENYNSFDQRFIKGNTQQIKDVLNHVQAVAPTDITVLIQGESGSGKEFIAKSIHYASKRNKMPFVAVDCGALPKDLANSELFGHKKGSFTGAINDKKGYFEQAKGGTIFLDEIGNLPYENQVKLLRALQERVINKVGDDKTIKIDVRVIAATNEDLFKEVSQNRFREDLYHRINGFKINLPSLRDRKDDIIVFAGNFLKKANHDFGKAVEGFDREVIDIFMEYPWYGNIRELENVVKRCVLLSTDSIVNKDLLPEEIKYFKLNPTYHKSEKRYDSGVTELKEATFEAEKEVIANALKESNYNKSKAAKLLKIDRKTLYNKIKQYEIDVINQG